MIDLAARVCGGSVGHPGREVAIIAKLLGCIVILLTVSGHAWAQRQPAHLVPVDPRPPVGAISKYLALSNRMLRTTRHPSEAVMFRRPSFQPESCLTIIADDDEETPQFVAVLTRASRNIWYAMPKNTRAARQMPIWVTRHEASLPPEIASRVLALWHRMLAKVRYPWPDEDSIGIDGEVIEFQFKRPGLGRRYGETWSPSKGPTKLFVDLGASVAAYCEAPAAARPARLADIGQRCKALEDCITEAGKK